MKKLPIAALVALATVSGAAIAGETGTINQTGMYERTQVFYLHPAQMLLATTHAAVRVPQRATAARNPDQDFYLHPALMLVSGESTPEPGMHPAVLVQRIEGAAVPPAEMPAHPVLARRDRHTVRVAHGGDR